jgi:uncharacterized membrane protein YfcA
MLLTADMAVTIALGMTLPIVVLLSLIGLWLWWRKERRQRRAIEEQLVLEQVAD